MGVVNPCPVQYHTLYMDYNCLQRTYWYRPAHPVGVAKATPLSNPNGLLIQYDVWDRGGGGGGGGGTFLGETPPFGSV